MGWLIMRITSSASSTVAATCVQLPHSLSISLSLSLSSLSRSYLQHERAICVVKLKEGSAAFLHRVAMIEIKGLIAPEYLIEIEATAIVG